VFIILQHSIIKSLLIIPIFFLSVALNNYYYLSIIIYSLSLIILFDLTIYKKLPIPLIIFGLSSAMLDAYNNNIIGITFLSAILASHILKFFLIIINYTNYLNVYRVQAFAFFFISFNTIFVILKKIICKNDITIFSTLTAPIIIICMYCYINYKRQKNNRYLYQTTKYD